MEKHRFLMWFALLFIGVVSGYAQQLAITGRVLDSKKEPLIGVTILLKGSANGTVTDIDGNFSIKASKGETLVVSYIGYKTQEVQAVAGKVINVMLKDDTEMLDEVKGFGSQDAIAGSVVRTDAFDKKYAYDGDDLGATYTSAKTGFKVWAPTATKVELVTYQSDDVNAEVD